MLLFPVFQNICDNFNDVVSSESCIQLLLRWLEKLALSPLARMINLEYFIQGEKGDYECQGVMKEKEDSSTYQLQPHSQRLI